MTRIITLHHIPVISQGSKTEKEGGKEGEKEKEKKERRAGEARMKLEGRFEGRSKNCESKETGSLGWRPGRPLTTPRKADKRSFGIPPKPD